MTFLTSSSMGLRKVSLFLDEPFSNWCGSPAVKLVFKCGSNGGYIFCMG
jgi:hypothetical protein